MPDATRKELSEVAEIVMGQSPPGTTYNDHGKGLPFFQGKAEFGEVSPTAVKWCTDPRRTAERGDILMSVRAPVGPTNLATERCCIGRGLAAIRADATKLEPNYLRYFLRYSEQRLACLGQGSTFSAIGRAEIASLRIPLPNLEDQRRIADLLSRAENIVRMRREAEQKAKEIIPTLFLDMFGDPGANKKGWATEALSSVSEISYGIATKLDSSVTAEAGRRILTISNVMVDGELDLSIERYSQSSDRKAASAEVKTGDLLFNWRNGSETHIGKTAIWERSDSALHVSFLLRLRPDQEKATSLYLWALLNRLRSSGFFLAVSRQQVNRKFNASELSALRVPVAPLELQQRFASNATELRRHAITQRGASVISAQAFQSLLAGVFSERRAT